MTTDNRKQAILAALRKFIAQRPGMDPRNYDPAGYRSESRQVTRDRHDAERLLREVELRDSISADDILKEAGGRLTIEMRPVIFCQEDTDCAPVNGICPTCDTFNPRVSYCTGQYFPTEYRKAVARLMASVLWTWTREQCMPEALRLGEPYYAGNAAGSPSISAGDWLRAHFSREFGKALAERYFS